MGWVSFKVHLLPLTKALEHLLCRFASGGFASIFMPTFRGEELTILTHHLHYCDINVVAYGSITKDECNLQELLHHYCNSQSCYHMAVISISFG